MTPDATNDKITIAASGGGGNYTGMSQSDARTGTSSTNQLISAATLRDAINYDIQYRTQLQYGVYDEDDEGEPLGYQRYDLGLWHTDSNNAQSCNSYISVCTGDNINFTWDEDTGDCYINATIPNSLFVYEDLHVAVDIASGNIGTRGQITSLGTTVLNGYLYLGTIVIDQRNTATCFYNISVNSPNNTVHLVVYRATGSAITGTISVRKIWIKENIIQNILQ